jgi:hypothetical protein
MPSLFPDIQIPQIQTASSPVLKYEKELAFDFASGDFIYQDGKPKVLDGLSALRVWVEKAVRTARYRFPIYTFDYGCELQEIIGYDIPGTVLESEISRVIREALLINSLVTDVQNFAFERGGSRLKVSFTVITALGDTLSQEVIT